MSKTEIVINQLRSFATNLKREHTGPFAAQSTLFLIMSYLPMLFLIIAFISNISPATALNAIESMIPYMEKSVLHEFSAFKSGPVAFLSLSGVFSAWSAGKAFKALTEGLHGVLRICETRNYIFARLRGLVYSLVFAVFTGLLVLLGVFGDSFYLNFIQKFPDSLIILGFLKFIRRLFIPIFLFIIHLFIYRFVPDWSEYCRFGKRRFNFRSIATGAFFSSVVICIYTVIFKIWADTSETVSGFCGGVTTLVLTMLWMYASMYIMILGFKLARVITLRDGRTDRFMNKLR